MEIKELIESYEEPDLTLYIVNTEIFKEKIPFTKKIETELPRKKKVYFHTTTKKSKNLIVYDFFGHFEKFGFEWENARIGFKYSIKKVGQKIQKKKNLNKETRRKIVVDESRFFNMRADFNYGDSAPVSKRISFTGGYL